VARSRNSAAGVSRTAWVAVAAISHLLVHKYTLTAACRGAVSKACSPVEVKPTSSAIQEGGLDFAIGVRATKPGRHPINGYFRVGYIHGTDKFAMISLRLNANVNGTE
jgi:hypothetical protein